MSGNNYIAVDLGAASGRVMLVTIENETIHLQEVYRFINGPIEQDDSLRWDFNRLMNEIYTGIEKTLALEKNIQSIGIDTWGVDYGLLDEQGKLIENPYHYRDHRTDGILEYACTVMPRQQIYRNTGLQFLTFNTLYQLIACRQQRPDLLARARHLLFMPNLVMYHLCGTISTEYTIASTSQLMDMKTGQWSDAILNAFDLPGDILPDIARPGSTAGYLKPELADKWSCKPFPVISVGTHDTASAVAAVPAEDASNWAFLSSGTWSPMGLEIPAPIINEQTSRLEFTNEGGVQNTIRLLKNIMGLWLIQECRRYWAKQGHNLDYNQITELAANSQPFQARIDPEDPSFLAPGRMPEKINEYLIRTGQKEIHDNGQLLRVIFESLALRYFQVLENLETLSQKTIDTLHIVGGGSQNDLLNQLTANTTGKKILAGPVEATILGNVLIQSLAQNQITSLPQARKIIARSFPLKTFRPENT
ncbi:MAG: rhamnulokinase [Sedimentisphaerales bacterium]|nr:rhamnulokinase [Sedimentisphaerales bacterium]